MTILLAFAVTYLFTGTMFAICLHQADDSSSLGDLTNMLFLWPEVLFGIPPTKGPDV